MLYVLDSVRFTNHKSAGYEYWMTKTVQPLITRSLYGNAAYKHMSGPRSDPERCTHFLYW